MKTVTVAVTTETTTKSQVTGTRPCSSTESPSTCCSADQTLQHVQLFQYPPRSSGALLAGTLPPSVLLYSVCLQGSFLDFTSSWSCCWVRLLLGFRLLRFDEAEVARHGIFIGLVILVTW